MRRGEFKYACFLPFLSQGTASVARQVFESLGDLRRPSSDHVTQLQQCWQKKSDGQSEISIENGGGLTKCVAAGSGQSRVAARFRQGGGWFQQSHVL